MDPVTASSGPALSVGELAELNAGAASAGEWIGGDVEGGGKREKGKVKRRARGLHPALPVVDREGMAELLGVTVDTVTELTKTGVLPVIEVGQRIRWYHLGRVSEALRERSRVYD